LKPCSDVQPQHYKATRTFEEKRVVARNTSYSARTMSISFLPTCRCQRYFHWPSCRCPRLPNNQEEGIIVPKDYTAFPCQSMPITSPTWHFVNSTEGISSTHVISGTRASSPVTRRLISDIDLARCPRWLQAETCLCSSKRAAGFCGTTPLMQDASKMA
jgi:hypothetical protein